MNIAFARFEWTFEAERDGKTLWTEQGKNIVTYEGLNYMLNASFKAGTQETAFYASMFKNNVVPALTDTAATALGSGGLYGEVTDDDMEPLTNRPQVIWGDVTDGVVDNADNRLEFTCVASSLTLYGGFLTTTQPKLDTSGKLICAKRFDVPRTLIQNDILYVIVRIILVSG